MNVTCKPFVWMLCGLAAAASLPAAEAPADQIPAAPVAAQTRIQIALLLDTSNSMDGLIAQAKAQLWKVINEFAHARRNGLPPELQVALYEYGKPTLPAEDGFLRMIQPLTVDLDKISEELFALKTNGGEEFCGRVIQAAVDKLAWSASPGDLKAIFIAGNEPFNQGDVDFHQACKAAASRGICVNTIFCGPSAIGISTFWKDGAVLADGSYMSIDQNQQVADVPAPQDKEIARLGIELNRTYVAFGAEGKAAMERQSAQDKNSESLGSSNSAQRAACKASCNYRNSSWDLVDALSEKKVKIEELKPDELPEEMRKMTLEEKKAYLEAKAKDRKGLQEQVNKLSEARQKFVAEAMKQQAAEGGKSFDEAMIKVLKDQAEKKKITLQ